MPRGQRITVLFATMLLASLLPEPAQASHSRWALMKPTVGSYDGDARLNQGYHVPESGVDWDDEDGDGTCCGVGRNIFFNAWVYRDSAAVQSVLWVTYYQSDTTNCTRFRAKLYEDTDRSRVLGYMNYRHANVDDPQAGNACSGSSDGIACRNTVGLMQSQAERTASGDSCGWTGVHVHSGHTASTSWGTWTLNVGSAPSGIPNGSGVWTYHNPGYESAVTERRVDWCNPDSIC